MRLGISEDGSFEISGMREIENFFLNQIGAAADPGESAEARGRIFPDSAIRGDEPGAEDFSPEDWRELVVPELEVQFRGAVQVVQRDLGNITSELRDGEERIYSLVVPAKHADAWYSALNQARLVLAERYDLPMSEEELEREGDKVNERWLSFAQSNVYAFIQSFLLETILRIPD